jgi:hypothetical protein
VKSEFPPVKSEVPPVNRSELKVKSKLEAKSELKVKSELPPVKSELPPMKSELPPVKLELPSMKSEPPSMKSELPPVKSELPPVKSELPPVKSELEVKLEPPVKSIGRPARPIVCPTCNKVFNNRRDKSNHKIRGKCIVTKSFDIAIKSSSCNHYFLLSRKPRPTHAPSGELIVCPAFRQYFLSASIVLQTMV